MINYCTENAKDLAMAAYQVAMVLFAVSYSVRDILWLRVLAVVAGVLGLPFFFACSETVLWEALFWNCLFVVINAIRLGILLYERRPVDLTEEQHRLHMLVFRGLSPQEMSRLLAVAEWLEAEPGEMLVRKGTTLDGLMMIYSGIVDVMSDGTVFAQSRDGQCIGEMSYVTGMPTSADVVANSRVRYVHWPKSRLNALLERDARIREVIHSVLGFDMAEKLTARSRLDSPSVRRIDPVV